MEKSNV